MKRCRAKLADGSACGKPCVRGSDFCLEHDRHDFTEEDEFSPHYCRDCGRHTPVAVLNSQGSLCDDCAAARELEAQRRAAIDAALQEADKQREEAQRRAAYEVNTGHGRCPACGSTNVAHFTTGGADGSAQAAFACCSCLFIAWPLALLAPWLFRSPEVPHYKCNCCGHGWTG